MLSGLLRSPSGQDTSSLKSARPEPVVTEVIPSPILERANPMSVPATVHDTTHAKQSMLLSPTASVANSVRVTKRPSFYGKLSGSIRAVSGRFTTTFVQEQHAVVRQRCYRELGANVGVHAFDTSYAGLMEWIRAERLTRLPEKGGSWDRVLVAAQHFADQVHRLNQSIDAFTAESGAASHLVFGQCLLLLELGHENASALQTAFNLFYRFGLELSPLLRRAELFSASHSIAENVGKTFSELLAIVAGVAITFYQAVHGGRSSTRIDIYASFGSMIESFRLRVVRCSHEMWSYSLNEDMREGCQIEVIQKWLAPQDSVLAFLASDHINLTSRPEQFTCNWFQSHLNSFLRGNNDIMLIEGKAGSGKTTLAGWVVDRLQRPVGRKIVSTLSFSFNSSIMAQATPLSMLKTLMCQLISQQIGDTGLFYALNDAYAESRTLLTAEKQENRTWQAFEKALQAFHNDEDRDLLTIVVDGLDEVDGQKPVAKRVSNKLHDLVRKIPSIRLIQFSQPMEFSSHSVMHVNLSMENMYDDIRTVVRRGLSFHKHFSDREDGEQETIIEKLVGAADGSMLWISLAVQYLLYQNEHSAFNEALETTVKTIKTVSDMVHKLLTIMQLGSDSKSLLSWLVATERPLSLEEVGMLLSTDTKSSIMISRNVHLSALLESVAAFTVNGEGLIALRHNAIKQALISIPSNSKVSLQLKERHKDLVSRLLIFVKNHLKGEQDPTLTLLDLEVVGSTINSHRLLEYAVRYWTIHFKKSSLYKVSGDLELTKEFGAIFPSSIKFALLEQSCWRTQAFPHEALELYKVAFRVRKALFGADHACVLQSAIICAVFCETVLLNHTEAIEWYARAIKIGRVVVGAQAEIIISCCSTLLRISETFVSKKRTEIMTYREEVLLVLVTAYKHRYGSTSKEVLEIYQRLAELYVFISEETKSTEIYRIIHEITIVLHGGHSDEAEQASRHLHVSLKKHKHGEVVDTFEGSLFDYTEEREESFTLVRVDILIQLAGECIVRGEFEKAEELYVELWLKLTEHCHALHVLQWHEKRVEVMLLYARFLRSQERMEESSALLLCVWTEFQHHEYSMVESIIFLMKEVAICMKAVGMISVALTVFRHCWSWFKTSHKEEHSYFREIEEHITITSKEIVKSTSSTIITSTSETIIREVFESSITSTETEISSTTIELCKSLTAIYIEQSRYSEAITCIKSVLRKSWSSFFAHSTESITMSSSFSSESIELVMKLAHCYISQKRIEKAEYLYLRLYHVHRKSCKIDDIAVIRYSEIYLAFLTKHELWSQAITFYQGLLVEYRAHYGASHAMTIKILYALGDICRHHHLTHGYWIEYYLEIVTCLNQGAIICHEDAFRALIIVTEHYYESCRYSESLIYFKSIIATFCKFGTGYKYFEDHVKVKIIFERYYRAIEETKLEIHAHVIILKELRTACLKYYGEKSSVTISVTTVLAEVCCRHERYESEAISYYEHILKHSTSVSTEIVKRTQIILKTLYVKQITSSKTTVTKETMEKATTMTWERYTEIRKTHSCSHEITLSTLKELIMLYHKQSMMEIAIKELRSIAIECIIKITSAKEMVETAKFISIIFFSCGYTSQGYELIRQLKLQIIYGSITQGCGFDVTRVGRGCFPFIAAFEYHLRAEYSLTIAIYMANLVAEYQFYHRFERYIRIKSRLELVFVNAARLRQILVRGRRVEDFSIVEAKTLEYFTSTETSVVKHASRSSIKVFVHILLEHFSEHSQFKKFTDAAGYATIVYLRSLLEKGQHKEALELTTCVYKFLMAHEGLDDPTEITLGFQLCLLMAGRDKHNHQCNDPAIQKAMLDLSRQILGEVFDICKAKNINLVRCQLNELNKLITLIGEQKDYGRLQWLLHNLWSTREGQTTWPQNTVLKLGRRLVQAQFSAGNRTAAIRLCEDIVYNVRRVHGARNPNTLSSYRVLASLYTSLALHYQTQSASQDTKDKKRLEDMARVYFKKAVLVHEDVLKLLVDADGMDGSDEEDDLESEFDSPLNGSHGQIINGTNGTIAATIISRAQEVETVGQHVRLLKLALQRLGSWPKPAAEYERLTSKVWSELGHELTLKEADVSAAKWKLDSFGRGKAEAPASEDGFIVPSTWAIC